jgi:hypothetical protein
MKEWIDKNEYPFTYRYLDLPMGRIYVDEKAEEYDVILNNIFNLI